jgi:hypothetical protein
VRRAVVFLVLLVVASATPAALAAAPSFGPQTAVGGASVLTAGPLAVADFNGDGHLDLVYGVGADVDLLLGKGDGTFSGTPGFFSAPSPIIELLAQDLSGDGLVDIAVTRGVTMGNAAVSYFAGIGSGLFGAPVNAVLGVTGARNLVGADVTGDGRTDLVVGGYTGNGGSAPIYVLQPSDTATFATPAASANVPSPYWIAAGDLNGDGRADVASARWVGPSAACCIDVLTATPTSPFLLPPVPWTTDWAPHSIALGDVNGDGKLDAMTANWPASSASVLIGNGDGTFQAPVNYPVGQNPLQAAVGDVNGDGFVDGVLALSQDPAHATSILAGRGDGTFADALLVTGDTVVERAALGDLNEDGRLDLVERGRAAGGQATLTVRLNTTDYPDPAVTTGAASAIAEDAATVAGTIVSKGLPARWHFEYGTTAAYGARTPDVVVPAGPSTPSAVIGGLAPGTTYHYRLVVEGPAFGAAAGADATLTTQGRPTVTLSRASASVRWRLGRARGTVTVRGALSAAANLKLQLLRVRGSKAKAIATITTLKAAGAFSASIRVPGSVLPGRYRIAASGLSGDRPLVPTARELGIAAPAEGIVRRAFASGTSGGSPTLRLPPRSRHVWAYFVFASIPKRGPVVITWHTPRGTKVVTKPRRRVVSSNLSARSLPSGRYSAEARVRGVLVGRTAIRVG